MAQSSRIFRVFVSSTFSDLVAERNALQEMVFPRLRDLAISKGCRFQAIDLRWGVSDEAALDQQTMKICLGEIARSQKVSPRPNFIILLGDRYGWQPLPYEIPALEFEKLTQETSQEDRALLEHWYRLDQNAVTKNKAVPGVYCLLARTDDSVEYTAWEQVEARLREILQSAIQRIALSPDDTLKYVASATEQEIVAGAMRVPKAKEHVFAFVRQIGNLDEVAQDLPRDGVRSEREPKARDFIDVDGMGRPDESARARLATLRGTVSASLPNNIYECPARWHGDGISIDHIGSLPESLDECLALGERAQEPANLCEAVWLRLSRIILAEARKLADVDPLRREITAQETHREERSRVFMGRVDALEAIDAYIQADDPHPLAIWGASGSGKSALMAKAAELAQKRDPHVIYRFIGATPESSSIQSILKGICQQIFLECGLDRDRRERLAAFGDAPGDEQKEQQRAAVAAEYEIPEDLEALGRAFKGFLTKAARRRRVCIFLDALDQLANADNARSLNWLPIELPPNARVIVTTLEGECLGVLREKLSEGNLLELQPMSVEDGEAILAEWLGQASRTLQENQWNYLLARFEECRLPLYLKLAFEEAKLWRSYDGTPDLGRDVPGVLANLLARLSSESNHGRKLVSHSLGYLAGARNGLSEHEILDLLSLDEEVLSDFQRRSPRSPKANRLPVVIWSRLYADLEPYLTERSADGTVLLSFYHRRLAEVAQTEFLSGDGGTRRHQALARYFTAQPLRMADGDGALNLRKLSEMVYQQASAGLAQQVTAALFDYSWIEAKLAGQGVQELISDYGLADQAGVDRRNQEALSLLQSGLRLSGHVLARNPLQLPSQLTGRLVESRSVELSRFLDRLPGEVGRPWLRPLHACFEAPGKALVRIIEGTETKAIALTPDGRKLVSGSKVLDLESGQCVRALAGATEPSALAVTRDGKRLVSGSRSGVQLWDLENGECLRQMAGRVDAIALTPDGKKAVSGSDDSYLSVWDLERGELISKLKGHPNGVGAVAITSDGRYIVAGSGDCHWDSHHTVTIWSLDSGKCVRTLRGHGGYITSVDIAADSRRVVSGSGDGTVRLWNLENGKCLRTLKGHRASVSAVRVMPDGRRAISGSVDATLRVWDLDSGKCLRTAEGHIGTVWSLAVSPNGQFIISGSADGTIRFWNSEGGDENEAPHPTKNHSGAVNAIAVSPDRRQVASGSSDETVKAWDLETGECLWTTEGNTTAIAAVEITPDGRWAISGSDFPTVNVWDLRTGQCGGTLRVGPGFIVDLAAMPDYERVVWAGGPSLEGEIIKVWKLKGNECALTLEGHTRGVFAVALTLDGTRLVSGSEDHDLRLWDMGTGSCIRVMKGHEAKVCSVAVTAGGSRAVSGSDDHHIRIWDLGSGDCRQVIGSGDEWVGAVAATPDGERVASCAGTTWDARDPSATDDVCVWDASTGDRLALFEGATTMTAIAAVDKSTYVAGDKAGKLYFLRLEDAPRGA